MRKWIVLSCDKLFIWLTKWNSDLCSFQSQPANCLSNLLKVHSVSKKGWWTVMAGSSWKKRCIQLLIVFILPFVPRGVKFWGVYMCMCLITPFKMNISTKNMPSSMTLYKRGLSWTIIEMIALDILQKTSANQENDQSRLWNECKIQDMYRLTHRKGMHEEDENKNR